MMGTLITPTSASTAPARSARPLIFDRCLQRNEPDVEKHQDQSRSQPRIPNPPDSPGRAAQSDPVTSEMKVKMAPVGAIAVAIIDASRALKAQPTPAYRASSTYRNSIHAAGT